MTTSLADAALGRALGAPRARNSYHVEAVRVPMRDGVVLLADHFAPATGRPRGTVLVRTPYGRGFPTSHLNGRLLAAHGYHVLIQSVRGTFGSGGTFSPMAQETDDGVDTVAWLRGRPWFDGRLATLGGSYLGWTQWALLQDPPPEVKTVIVYVGPHDFRDAVYGRGAFTLGDFLGWSDQVATQEEGGLVRRALRGATAGRRMAPILAGLPLPDAAEPLLRGRAPWYRQWLSHPDGDDPWWAPYRANVALQRVDVPVLLVGGWQDLFVDQTLEQYDALRDRGVDVGLTIGGWTHLQVGAQGAPVVHRETLAWLDHHLAGEGAPRRRPVRVFRTGERAWHELDAWPPPSTPAAYRLRADGTLTGDPAGGPVTTGRADSTVTTDPDGGPVMTGRADGTLTDPVGEPRTAGRAGSAATTDPTTDPAGDPASDPATVTFRYDPADPTPSVGGRVLTGSMGVRDNRALEARADVRTFTSAPLPAALDLAGSPVAELAIEVDNAHADVFVRLCDVDRRGRSRNVADRLLRLDPSIPAGTVQRLTLVLDPCFHRVLPGHHLRLQVSGGAFPRYARNLGTAGTPVESHAMRPSVHTVHCRESRLVLPVTRTPAG